MRAWQIPTFGLDHLALVDAPDPTAPPGHVVVRVRAASLNYRDLMMVRGDYNPKQPLPLTPCSDGAGEIVDVGPECAAAVKIGARVATLFAQGFAGGRPTAAKIKRTLGGPLAGALATHIVLPEDGVAAIPDAWSFEEACTLPCAALTAWSALVEQGNVKPGDRVLVLGTGGVACFALQIARLAGARVLVVTAKPARALALAAPGDGDAFGVIDRVATPEWEREVRKRWPEGADHVVEVGGAGTLMRSIKSTAVGGTVSVIGVLAGAVEPVSVVPVLMQNIRLQGVFVGSRDGFLAMTRALASSSLRPVIDRVVPFDRAPDAFRALAAGEHVGKIVVAA